MKDLNELIEDEELSLELARERLKELNKLWIKNSSVRNFQKTLEIFCIDKRNLIENLKKCRLEWRKGK